MPLQWLVAPSRRKTSLAQMKYAFNNLFKIYLIPIGYNNVINKYVNINILYKWERR
jgi:hypothetical protein